MKIKSIFPKTINVGCVLHQPTTTLLPEQEAEMPEEWRNTEEFKNLIYNKYIAEIKKELPKYEKKK